MIKRQPETFSRDPYDLIIIGGGIYGVCLSLEASRRGLRALLLERDDFGGATSWNSLRILHGGLRYLQTLDLSRFRESVAERHWFSRNFPELVRPLPCLMPLYGRGLKRKAAFGPALLLNDWLSSHRNDGLADDVRLPNGRLLAPGEARSAFSKVDPAGLEGAGFWYDAKMVNSQRVVIQALRWACGLGARALNYVEARELLVDSGEVVGVRALDKTSDRAVEFRAPIVVNCAGPWSREVASRFDREIPRLFHASLAFNVFIDRTPLASTALAVQPRRKGSQVFFMHPADGGILLGTIHASWTKAVTSPDVPESLIQQLIGDVNQAIPGFDLKREDVVRVLSGFLPAAAPGSHSISRRPANHVHGQHGGPKGLVSLCGVKFTTARLVAQEALKTANPAWRNLSYIENSERPADAGPCLDLSDSTQLFESDAEWVRKELDRLVREEAVVYLEDLLYRRSDWGLNPRRVSAIIGQLSTLLPSSLVAPPGKSGPAPAHDDVTDRVADGGDR